MSGLPCKLLFLYRPSPRKNERFGYANVVRHVLDAADADRYDIS